MKIRLTIEPPRRPPKGLDDDELFEWFHQQELKKKKLLKAQGSKKEKPHRGT